MERSKPKKRYFSIALVVLGTLIVGLAAPLIFDARRINFDFEPDGVVAAPRDQFDIGAPMPVHGFSRAVVSSGRLIQVLPAGRGYSGKEARENLKKGSARLALENAEINIGNLASEFDGPAGIRKGGLAPPIVTALRDLRFFDLNVRRSRITVSLPGGFKETFGNVYLVVTGRNREAVSIKGTARWRGQDVKLDVETGRLITAKSAIPVIFKMDGRLISVRFTGSLIRKGGMQLEGDTEVKIAGLKAFANSQHVAWPAVLSAANISLQGPVKWTESAIAFERAAVKVDDNSATGALTVKRSQNLPLLSGTLAFDQLDLTQNKTQQTRDDSSLRASWWDTLAGIWTIPVVKYFNADLRLSAEEIVIGDAQMGKAAATVSLRDGELSAQLASLVFEGGSGNGQLTMNFNGLVPRTVVRGRLQGAPLGDLASTMLGVRSIDGRASVTVDLETRGSQARAMLESMSGKVQISLTEKGALGFDLGVLTKHPRTSDSSVSRGDSDDLIAAASKGTTNVQALDIDFKISSGNAECLRFDAKLDNKIAKLAGRINLPAQHLDIQALVYDDVAKGTGQTTTSAHPEKSIVGRRISLRGPWQRPLINLFDVTGQSSALEAGLKTPLPTHSE